ncbi:MAG TPA: ferritin-like domain-containing protein [Thermoanaerobaculia bacterium]|nr:ferritin-like domain-containing protein [Thermoanaerobaculia bacterium]
MLAKGPVSSLIGIPTQRPTSWWLETLRKRAERMYGERLDLSKPVAFDSEEERLACIKFFNAAYRAEESGKAGAHRLAEEVRAWDPDLAECLVLYGNEEGWHRELLDEFLAHIGGGVTEMGWMVSSFYKTYAKAERMESIMLTNLMFETIGATTYRLSLRRVKQPLARQVLTILTRDESFHVPLNVHFIREILKHHPERSRARLKAIYQMVFHSIVLLSLGSRKVAREFDQISWKELTSAYVENLGRLFVNEPDLDFAPPRHLLAAFGMSRGSLKNADGVDAISVAAAEAAARREDVNVTPL